MREYRRYRCDHGHAWEVLRDVGEDERPEDIVCPSGHEAIVCMREHPADEVQIVYRPAARIVDPVKNQVQGSGRYYLVLLDREDREICASANTYSWDEVVQMSQLFRGKTKSRALEYWNRRPR